MNPYQTWQLIGIYFAIAILLNAWWARPCHQPKEPKV